MNHSALPTPPRRPCGALVALFAAAIAAQASAQDDPLQRALAAEAAQVALIARLSPAVAAVFQGETAGQGGGSGVIIDPAGYVLTNFHVSGTAAVLTVGLDDGKTYRARLLGIDPGGDIALLKLTDEREWPFVPLGSSDGLHVGERVYAMGNPFLLAEDFRPTVTQGVVAGLHRYRDASGGSDLVYGDGIQIDASINPGNSGGPLFDARGELLGINGLGGFRPDRGRVNVGVGFAASIDQIKGFLLDLRACRQAQHATMNATVRDLEGEHGSKSRLVIDALMRGGCAYRAGLEIGDEVLAFDGERVTSQNQLLTRVSRLPAGRRITVQVARTEDGGGARTRLERTFRLDPLWSGPERGKWAGDPELIAAETARVLAAYRAAEPPRAWTWRATVRVGPAQLKQAVYVDGERIRVDTGRAVEAFDGKVGWRRSAEGALGELDAARRDELAGTAAALAALAEPRGEQRLKEVRFTGGAWLSGRSVIRLETRDRAGRQRRIYLDPERSVLVGLAYPQARPGGGERWVEESGPFHAGRGAWARVDDVSGAELASSKEAVFSAGLPEGIGFGKGSR